MKLFVDFKQYNPEFNKEYAKEYHGGKESDGNWKYNAQRGYRIDDCDSIKVVANGTVELNKKGPDGELEAVEFDDCLIIEVIKDGEVVDRFAASNSIISKTHQAHNAKYDTFRYYFYLKGDAQIHLVVEGVALSREAIKNDMKTS